MSRQAIQRAIFEAVKRASEPLRVRDLIAQLRAADERFQKVSDFDIRSSVLTLAVAGTIHTTSTNRLEVRSVQADGERG